MAKSPAVAIGHGATFEVDGDKITIVVDISKKARDAAPNSNSKKMKLVANTGGFQMIPGTDLKASLNIGFKPAA